MGAPLKSSIAKNNETPLPLSLLQIIYSSVSSYNIWLIHQFLPGVLGFLVSFLSAKNFKPVTLITSC